MSPISLSLLDRLKVAQPEASDWNRLQGIYLPLIDAGLAVFLASATSQPTWPRRFWWSSSAKSGGLADNAKARFERGCGRLQ